jgi:hypothetical protein
MTKEDVAIIAQCNDAFRVSSVGRGNWCVTAGVQANGPDFVQAAVSAVRQFTAFTADNDPYGEHDFGAVTVLGERLFFKIDYYDLTLRAHSPNAADAAVTHRVLTIMLANEY